MLKVEAHTVQEIFLSFQNFRQLEEACTFDSLLHLGVVMFDR